MTTRIDLPGGAWADIKAPDELTNRDRKLLRRYAMGAMGVRSKLLAAGFGADQLATGISDPEIEAKIGDTLTADDLDATDSAQSAFIVSYLSAWSLDRPLPTMDTVDDLPGPVFDALAKATTSLGDATPDFGPDGAMDPASPTVPSTV